MGRILALDVGQRRIGLALSDPLGITAHPLGTLERTRIRDDIAAIARLVEEHAVERVVVGLPLQMSGSEGRQAMLVRDFCRRLRDAVSIPVELWDERLTTVEAQRVLRSSGIGLEKRRQNIDKLAATVLLESYLDARGAGQP